MSTTDSISNAQDFPPAIVLWITGTIDTLCASIQSVVHCGDWRSALKMIPENSSWNVKVPPLLPHLPTLLTYPQYLEQTNQSLSFHSLYTYALQTPSTALGDLTTPTAALVLFLLVLLLRQIKAILLPIFASMGRAAARQSHGPEWEFRNTERIHKFGEYVFRLIYHSLISCYGVVYFWNKPWWAPGGTITLYEGFPQHEIEPGMSWYYLLQAAYNLDAMVSLIELSFRVQVQSPRCKGFWRTPVVVQWHDKVRGDFAEMFVHHVITNALVIGSSLCRLTRIGSMVFLVHDISDVPVDLSKLANFVKWKYTTLVCFLTMVAVWLVTRLYILPFVIYRSVLTQSHHVLDRGVPPVLYFTYRYFFYVGVALLILLHLAWFVMFLQIFTTFVRKHECHDLSEHKGGEEQEAKKEA